MAHEPVALPALSPPRALFQPANVKEENIMSTSNTYLAVFLGSKTSPKMTAWTALPEEQRRPKEREGAAARKAGADKHPGAGARVGGPPGKANSTTPPA